MKALSNYHDNIYEFRKCNRKPRRLSAYNKKFNKDNSISSQYNKLDTLSNNSISARLVCLSSRFHPKWMLSDFKYD